MKNKLIDEISIFWFRRDLRLKDNIGLYNALKRNRDVILLFIFDENIINDLKEDDPRITFIYKLLEEISEQIKPFNSNLLIKKGKPLEIIEQLTKEYNISKIYANKEYEPYSIKRDNQIEHYLSNINISFERFNDHLFFDPTEVYSNQSKPYTLFTPYSKKWLNAKENKGINYFQSENYLHSLMPIQLTFPALSELGFKTNNYNFPDNKINEHNIINYTNNRDYPYLDATSHLSIHLRYGSISIRECVDIGSKLSNKWLNELIWRDFYASILYHFPEVENKAFKKKYDGIVWENNQEYFAKWCNGETGYPIIDAGMKQLNESGFMHNRVRMLTASFLTKHLLIDWKWGEAYFAEKLLDFDLASNNGGWQWSAGTGCDAVPYFRIFNPIAQQKKYDLDFEYINKWIKGFNETKYIKPIVDHVKARESYLQMMSAINK